MFWKKSLLGACKTGRAGEQAPQRPPACLPQKPGAMQAGSLPPGATLSAGTEEAPAAASRLHCSHRGSLPCPRKATSSCPPAHRGLHVVAALWLYPWPALSTTPGSYSPGHVYLILCQDSAQHPAPTEPPIHPFTHSFFH